MKYLKKLNLQQVINIATIAMVFLLAFAPMVSVHAQDIFGGVPKDPRFGDVGGQTVGQVINNIIRLVLSIVGLIALIFLIVGGFRYMTAGGDEEKVGKAKTTIINALIGLVIVILSYALVALVYNFADNGLNRSTL